MKVFLLLLSGIVGVALMGSIAPRPAFGQTVGGYKRVDSKSKESRQTVTFALAAQSRAEGSKVSLVRILHVERQIVAGTNYRICMRVRNKRGRGQTVTAVVNKDLHGERTLSSWTPGKCETE